MESRFPEGSVVLEEVREREREGSMVVGRLEALVRTKSVWAGRLEFGVYTACIFFDTGRIKYSFSLSCGRLIRVLHCKILGRKDLWVKPSGIRS